MRIYRDQRIRAPELRPEAWAGEPARLAALTGRVVLLDFFSFGDPDGIRSLPRIRELGDHYRDAGLAVIGVHVPAYEFERPTELARREIWRLGLPYPVALDHGFVTFRDYGNGDLPTRHLVDGDGFARARRGGAGGLVETENAIRHLLAEAGRSLPRSLSPDPRFLAPGQLAWLPTEEVRFGARGSGFAAPPEHRTEGPDEEGSVREFPELPDVRAEGHPYLEGRWTVGRDRVRCDSNEGALAIVFQGSSVDAVLSVERAEIEPEADEARIEITLDGEALADEVAGADVETTESRSTVTVERGRVYSLVDGAEFGIHNLDLRVLDRGVAVHLLAFGTVPVPSSA